MFYNAQDITEGIETKLLNEYKSLYYKSNQLISAWMYLQNIYKNDNYWLDTLKSNSIGNEIQYIQAFEQNITKDLDKTSYLNYYISIFKLINTTPYLVNYNKQKISSELVKYRKINLLDDKIWKSGLKSNDYFMKFCGSGGGGFFLAFDFKNNLKAKLNTFELIEI